MPPATDWSRYPKIAESSAPCSSTTGEWICTEKAHGANFSSVAAPAGNVLFASRSGVLADSDNFFGFKSVGLDSFLESRICALREELVRVGIAGADATVIIYGELCGGHYPHADVPAVNGGVGPVQRGIWYSPTLCFIGFDIAVLDSSNDDETGAAEPAAAPPPRFLDFDVARAAAIAAGIRFTTPLLRGTLAQCLDAEVRFASTIPAALGLPPLPAEVPNLAEGLVVRPAREPAAASAGRGSRGLIKRKIPEFSEKQYSNEEWRSARHGMASGGGGGGGVSWAEAEDLVRYEMLAAINQQRLDAVVSKVGQVDTDDKPACRQLLRDFMVDVAEALVEDGLLAARHVAEAAAPPLQQLTARHPLLHEELEKHSRTLVARFLRRRM